MSSGDTFGAECQICLRIHHFSDMVQILPCFHLFCKQCIHTMASYRKINFTTKGRKYRDTGTGALTCPAANCHSQMLGTSSDAPIVINYCDNMMCPKKLSHFETTRLSACQHEICMSCLEESVQRQPPTCIVENCDRTIAEIEEPPSCDNCGKSVVDSKKLTVTSCCKCHFCEHCVENREKEKLFERETLKCTEGNCPPKKKKGSLEEETKCKAKEGCKGIALNGFPSNSECSHDVCMDCLTQMISDCEATGLAPMCPHPSCSQYYTVESVNALRTLFPQNADFFDRFDLDERKLDLFLKDDSVTFVDLSSEFDFESRRMSVRVMGEADDETERLLVYDKQGTVGDFIREIRCALRILPFEKVYGYYIKREENEPKAENEMDEEIQIDAASLTRPISELHLTPTCIVRVDTAGIVQQKSSTNVT